MYKTENFSLAFAPRSLSDPVACLLFLGPKLDNIYTRQLTESKKKKRIRSFALAQIIRAYKSGRLKFITPVIDTFSMTIQHFSIVPFPVVYIFSTYCGLLWTFVLRVAAVERVLLRDKGLKLISRPFAVP